MKKGTRSEVRVHVNASAQILYELVSDVSRMGEWSPECESGEWLDGATGPSVGARFKGKNRHGRARWTTKPRVVAAEPAREFGFVTQLLGRDMTRWVYRFENAGGGSEVTESFELLRSLPVYIRLTDRLLMGVKDRQADLEDNMRRTLAKIKSTAEHGSQSHNPR